MGSKEIKNALLLFFLFFFATSSHAQDMPKELVEKFFNEYKKEGISSALDNLYATNENLINNTEGIIYLKNQMQKDLTEENVGKYHGYELIVEKNLSESYLLLSYLIKYEGIPHIYNFQFYKPDKKWKLYSFKFYGNIEGELEHAAKVYN